MTFDAMRAAKILEPHWPAIERHFEVLSARYASLVRADHEPIGRILKSHLIIESFMTAFLQGYYRNSDIEGARLSFYQKAALLPESTAAGFLKPGILQLNSLRNKFAHRLDHVPRSEDVSEIVKLMDIARPAAARTPIETIEAFTPVACAWLDIPPEDLREALSQAFTDVPANPLTSPGP